MGIFFQQEEIGTISSRLYVAEKTVHRILYLYLLTSDVSPRKQQSGPVRKLSDCEELQLLDAIFKNPGIYLDEFTMHSHIVYIKLLCHENTVNYTD